MPFPAPLARLLLPDPDDDALEQAVAFVARTYAEGEAARSALAKTLEAHRLTALIATQLARTPQGRELALVRDYEASRLRRVVLQLAQEGTLQTLTHALETAGIVHVIFKGAQLARTIYAERDLRPGVDIDVLVAPDDLPAAIDALQAVGIEPRGRTHALSHELDLTDGRSWIDLHWHLLRPGRMRREMVHDVLASRVREHDLWVPDDSWTLIILLFHPAITDALTGRVNRAADLARWLLLRQADHGLVARRLHEFGLATAAWTTLAWTEGLVGRALATELGAALSPGRLRQAYLRRWIAADPAVLYQAHPNLVRGLFSLALQDSPTDLPRAVLHYGFTQLQRHLFPTALHRRLSAAGQWQKKS